MDTVNGSANAAPGVEQKAAPKNDDVAPTIKALCLFLGILALGAGGYILYDKVIAKGDKLQCEEAIKDDTEKKDENSKDEDDNKTSSLLTGHVQYETIGVYGHALYFFTSDGEVYIQYFDKDGKSLIVKNADNLGKAASYTIPYSKLGKYGPPIGSPDEKEITINNAYKLDLKNVMYAFEIGEGQAKMSLTTAFVDTDGNMSVLVIGFNELLNETGANSGVALYKNVEKNVAGMNLVDGRDYVYTLVHYRDGSQKSFDFEKLK